MYLAIIQYKKKWDDEWSVTTHQFNTKEQANKFTWDELCNKNKKCILWKSEVCKLG
jgi:hypothetical protein